ncbi:MAG: hypothetical protein WCK98_03380 [bacterium]
MPSTFDTISERSSKSADKSIGIRSDLESSYQKSSNDSVSINQARKNKNVMKAKVDLRNLVNKKLLKNRSEAKNKFGADSTDLALAYGIELDDPDALKELLSRQLSKEDFNAIYLKGIQDVAIEVLEIMLDSPNEDVKTAADIEFLRRHGFDKNGNELKQIKNQPDSSDPFAKALESDFKLSDKNIGTQAKLDLSVNGSSKAISEIRGIIAADKINSSEGLTGPKKFLKDAGKFFTSLRKGIGQAINTAGRDIKNGTVALDLRQALQNTNKEFGNENHSVAECYNADVEFIKSSLAGDLKNLDKLSPETRAKITKVLEDLRLNYESHSKKVEDSGDHLQEVTSNYYGAKTNREHVINKYALRAALMPIAGITALVGGPAVAAAIAMPIAAARGLATTSLEESNRGNTEFDNAVRGKLRDLNQVLSEGAADPDNVQADRESPSIFGRLNYILETEGETISQSEVDSLTAWSASIVGNYGKQLDGRTENALLTLNSLLYNLKSQGKVGGATESIVSAQVQKITSEKVSLDSSIINGSLRSQSDEKAKEGRTARILLGVGAGVGAAGAGFVLRDVLFGGGNIKGAMGGIFGKDAHYIPGDVNGDGKPDFIMASSHVEKIPDGFVPAKQQGYGDLKIYVPKDHADFNPSPNQVEHAITNTVDTLPLDANNPVNEFVSKSGHKIPGVYSIKADDKLLFGEGLNFRKGGVLGGIGGENANITAGESGKVFKVEIDGISRQVSVVGRHGDGSLIVADVHTNISDSDLSLLNKEPGVRLYQSASTVPATTNAVQRVQQGNGLFWNRPGTATLKLEDLQQVGAEPAVGEDGSGFIQEIKRTIGVDKVVSKEEAVDILSRYSLYLKDAPAKGGQVNELGKFFQNIAEGKGEAKLVAGIDGNETLVYEPKTVNGVVETQAPGAKTNLPVTNYKSLQNFSNYVVNKPVRADLNSLVSDFEQAVQTNPNPSPNIKVLSSDEANKLLARLNDIETKQSSISADSNIKALKEVFVGPEIAKPQPAPGAQNPILPGETEPSIPRRSAPAPLESASPTEIAPRYVERLKIGEKLFGDNHFVGEDKIRADYLKAVNQSSTELTPAEKLKAFMAARNAHDIGYTNGTPSNENLMKMANSQYDGYAKYLEANEQNFAIQINGKQLTFDAFAKQHPEIPQKDQIIAFFTQEGKTPADVYIIKDVSPFSQVFRQGELNAEQVIKAFRAEEGLVYDPNSPTTMSEYNPYGSRLNAPGVAARPSVPGSTDGQDFSGRPRVENDPNRILPRPLDNAQIRNLPQGELPFQPNTQTDLPSTGMKVGPENQQATITPNNANTSLVNSGNSGNITVKGGDVFIVDPDGTRRLIPNGTVLDPRTLQPVQPLTPNNPTGLTHEDDYPISYDTAVSGDAVPEGNIFTNDSGYSLVSKDAISVSPTLDPKNPLMYDPTAKIVVQPNGDVYFFPGSKPAVKGSVYEFDVPVKDSKGVQIGADNKPLLNRVKITIGDAKNPLGKVVINPDIEGDSTQNNLPPPRKVSTDTPGDGGDTNPDNKPDSLLNPGDKKADLNFGDTSKDRSDIKALKDAVRDRKISGVEVNNILIKNPPKTMDEWIEAEKIIPGFDKSSEFETLSKNLVEMVKQNNISDENQQKLIQQTLLTVRDLNALGENITKEQADRILTEHIGKTKDLIQAKPGDNSWIWLLAGMLGLGTLQARYVYGADDFRNPTNDRPGIDLRNPANYTNPGSNTWATSVWPARFGPVPDWMHTRGSAVKDGVIVAGGLGSAAFNALMLPTLGSIAWPVGLGLALGTVLGRVINQAAPNPGQRFI